MTASPDAADEPPSAAQAASDLLTVVRTLETPAPEGSDGSPDGSPDFDGDPQAVGNGGKPGSARDTKERKRTWRKRPGNTPGVQTCACNAPWCLAARQRATSPNRRTSIPTGSKDEAKQRRAAWFEHMPCLPPDCGEESCTCKPVRQPPRTPALSPARRPHV